MPWMGEKTAAVSARQMADDAHREVKPRFDRVFDGRGAEVLSQFTRAHQNNNSDDTPVRRHAAN